VTRPTNGIAVEPEANPRLAGVAGSCPTADPRDAHPLELIPFFRRWPCGFWRDLVYTGIFNTLLAGVFTVLATLWSRRYGLLELFWVNFVFAQCVGYAMHALYAMLQRAIPRGRWHTRWGHALFWGLVPVAGVTLGYALAATLLGWSDFLRAMFTPRGLATIAVLALVIAGILFALIAPRARAAQAEAAIAREQARVAAAEREAALAQMKALQAQVEPHFLYNTLAHVASLVDREPRAARAMLDRLIALLRATARADDAGATLGGQAALVGDYLELIAMRMGPRLSWSIDIPGELANVPLPPALLQPLVENAVKHGLEPKVDGGHVDVGARERDGMLEIVVADTGAGFAATAAPLGGSTALGLSLLKKRLRALHGDRATLTLVENQPFGVRATLRLPLAHGRATP
jgi:signal transduction histidine kinase